MDATVPQIEDHQNRASSIILQRDLLSFRIFDHPIGGGRRPPPNRAKTLERWTLPNISGGPERQPPVLGETEVFGNWSQPRQHWHRQISVRSDGAQFLKLFLRLIQLFGL